MFNRCAIAILCCLLSLSLRAELRLALIGLDEPGKAHAARALAELSQEQGLAFLEREELAKIEDELRLAPLSDFTPDPRLMQNTQLFLLMKQDQLIAFDSATGVRLKDCRLRGPGEAVPAIRAAVAKQRGFAAGTSRRLSAMPLVPVNLSESQEKLAREAETRLLRHLCDRPALVLLERRHLLHLLNEPGAATNDLTGRLFAGALVLKPTARPEGRNGIQLHLQFFSPDGKALLREIQITLADRAALDRELPRFLDGLRLPDATAEDKRGEARNFIYEAWFALSHGLPADAVASGASAAALDRAYREELSRIAFFAASRCLGQGYYRRLTDAEWDLALANFRLGLRLTEELGGFSRNSRFAASSFLTGISVDLFRRLPPPRQEALLHLTERLVHLRKQQLDREILPLIDENAPRWPDAIFHLETLGHYLYELDCFCNLPWDYRWWKAFAAPVLDRFLAKSRDLQPEIERFMALTERIKIVSRRDLKQRRAPSNRQKAYLELPPHLGFRIFDPVSLTPDCQAFLQDIFTRLAHSNFMPLALDGLNGLMRLRTKGQVHRLTRDDQEFLYKHLLRIFQTTIRPGSEGLPLLLGADPEFLPRKLELQELAIRRFQRYDLIGHQLIEGHEKWDPKTARSVYDRLGVWLRECDTKPAPADRIAADRQRRAHDYLRRLQQPLERRFGFRPDGLATLPAANPFGKTWTPFPDRPNARRHPAVLGMEGDTLYVRTIEERHVVLWAIDTARQMACTEVCRIYRFGKPSELRFCAILDHYFVATNDTVLALYPRNGGAPELLDLASLGIRRLRWTNGCGDRLFLCCGDQYAGSTAIYEYHLPTRALRTIASTLDRTVDWPLKGATRPYEFWQILRDPEHHRLVMLLNESEPPSGHAVYNVRIYAYDWKSRQWTALSHVLPCHQPTPPNRIAFLGNTLWLATDYGFGPINAEGDWQPLFLLDHSGHPATQHVRFGSSSFKKVVIDRSRLTPPPPYANDLQLFDLHCCAFNGDTYFGRRAYFVPATRQYYRYADEFTVTFCIGTRFVAGQTPAGQWQLRECLPPATR